MAVRCFKASSGKSPVRAARPSAPWWLSRGSAACAGSARPLTGGPRSARPLRPRGAAGSLDCRGPGLSAQVGAAATRRRVVSFKFVIATRSESLRSRDFRVSPLALRRVCS